MRLLLDGSRPATAIRVPLAAVVAIASLVVGSCAADERPRVTEDEIETGSGAVLTIDPAAPTSSSAPPMDTRLSIDANRAATPTVPAEALLRPDLLPAGWAEGVSTGAGDLIDACRTVETMNPERSGVAGPVVAAHDQAGTTLVQAVFHYADAATSRQKLLEMESSLAACNGIERRERRIRVDPVDADVASSVAALGPARLTARIVAEGDDDTLVGDLVAVESGQFVVAVLVIGPAGAAEATLAPLAGQVVTTALAALPTA